MSSSIEFRLSAPRIEHVLLRDKTLKYVKTLYKVDFLQKSISKVMNIHIYKFSILSRNESNKMLDVIGPYTTRFEDDDKGAVLKIHKGK
jgi:hypothetical protein